MGLTGEANEIASALSRNAYVPPGGFSKWATAAAAAKAGTGTATVWGLGASIVDGGTVVADVMTDGYFAQWRQAKVNAGYPIHGDTLLSTKAVQYQALATSTTGFPFVYDAAPNGTTPWGFYGPFTVPIWSTTVTLPLIHYVHPSVALGYNARSLRIFYWDPGSQDGGISGSGATWHYNVDGANDATVTLTGSNTIKTIDITNLANSAGHTLNFGNQSAGGAMMLIGVASYPGIAVSTTGVHYSWFSQNGGFSLGDLGRTDLFWPSDRIARFIGTTSTAALFTPSSTLSPPFAPDLCFIDVFDDMPNVGTATYAGATPSFSIHGLPPDAHLHVLRRICQALRRKSTGCDIVHHMPNFADGTVSDTAPGASYNLQNAWHYYLPQYQLAQLNGHGYLNTDAEWGGLGLTLGYLSAGNPHPTKAGFTDIANRIASRLGL